MRSVGLGLDTSSEVIATALVTVERGETVAARLLEAPRGAARETLNEVGKLLRDAGVGLEEVAFFAVGIGPGSYMGVRVGIATALGVALGRGIPALGVPSLEAAALEAPPEAGWILATEVAGRDREALYGQLFRRVKAGGGRDLEAASGAQRLVRSQVVEFLRHAGRCAVFGEKEPKGPDDSGGGARVRKRDAEGVPGVHRVWVTGPGRDRVMDPPVARGLIAREGVTGPNLAECVACLGRLRWKEGLGGQTLALVPLYLRPPTASAPTAGRTS